MTDPGALTPAERDVLERLRRDFDAQDVPEDRGPVRVVRDLGWILVEERDG